MILTREMLATLLAFTARSSMKIAQEADWHYANLMSALKGSRPIPRPRYPALLSALGLTPDGYLAPRKVFPARCDEVQDLDKAKAALAFLFPQGGQIREVKVGHSIAALARSTVWRTWLVRDLAGTARLALRVDVVPAAADPLGEELAKLGAADFGEIGLEVLSRVEAAEDQCSALWNGTITPEAFDALMYPDQEPEPDWEDVRKAAERLGLSPKDVLKLVLASAPDPGPG